MQQLDRRKKNQTRDGQVRVSSPVIHLPKNLNSTPSGMAGCSTASRFPVVTADDLSVIGFCRFLGTVPSLFGGWGGWFDPGLIHSSAESLH